MTTNKLKLGGIYKTEWDERPFRVIGCDDIEVFYDCLWSQDGSWTFSGNFKRRCYFYRTSSSLFASKSKQIDFTPLTDQEHNAFRPDLQMRFGRTKKYDWNNFSESCYTDFLELVDKSFIEQRILTNKLVLIPFGEKGGLKKGSVILADNLIDFSIAEVIWKAKELQELANTQISNGIGLYRMGFEKGLPSYYIGSFIDKAGLISE